MTSPKADILDPITDLIESATGVKSLFGAAHLANNNVPPRYVWVPTTGPVDGPSNVGDYPRSLGDVAMTFEVHCWAADFDSAWKLFTVLVSAIRQKITANYTIGAVDALPTDYAIKGWVLTVPIAIVFAILEEDLDQPGYVFGQATSAEIDSSQGVDPDGLLTAPDK